MREINAGKLRLIPRTSNLSKKDMWPRPDMQYKAHLMRCEWHQKREIPIKTGVNR